MKLTMLGTGNALVTRCYNTCFVAEHQGEYLLVDGGGGNTLLTRLEDAGIPWKRLRKIFVTHKHIDHLLGIIWLVRLICQNMAGGKYEGDAAIYGHSEVIDLIRTMGHSLLQKKQAAFLDDRLHLVTLEDGDCFEAAGGTCQAFDIHSTKARQFGFTLRWEDKKLTCCGDEPYDPCEYPYAVGSDWLLHEAFCLDGQADIFHPYEKNHSTVKDACCLAEELGVKHLVLYHTEDANLANRKALYLEEGRQYYHGDLHIPEDLEEILCG